jgi:hypothetical protein
MPLNGRGLAVPAVRQAFLERVERMWIVVAQAKLGQLTERVLHPGSRAKAEPTWLCCASAPA